MSEEQNIGVFFGLESSKNEYVAEIIAPFQSTYRPEIGSFMLIDNAGENIVARVMDYAPKGELTSFMGQKWLSDVALEPDAIGHDIKSRKISYRVKIKLLGKLSSDGSVFTPGIRDVPHMTSAVKSAGTESIKNICNQALQEQQAGPLIGKYWLDENVDIHFNINDLISKRSFIFARAGYGKSNLMKVIASNWKPGIGSLVIFDQEGEYGFTDQEERPGILDHKPAILITNRRDFIGKKNVYSKLKINLKEIDPELIIPILIPESKHQFIFFGKLMNIGKEQWANLVDLLYNSGWGADNLMIRDIVEGAGSSTPPQDIQPIKNNLVSDIRALHDPESRLFSIIDQAIKSEHILIIDISLLNSKSALKLASLIVKNVLNNNKLYFTSEENGRLRRAVFVIEEAQNVLGETDIDTFVELAKEGRKYQLGAIFITQQPGSISNQILSQADNFFVFHLLSKNDLKRLQDANAHYSDDIITQILSEPVKGKSYMWTSHQPFVIPIKIINFEGFAKPNCAEELQKNNLILDEILNELASNNKIYKSILDKYKDLYSRGVDDKKITVDLFKNLDPEEKEWCRDKQHIQLNRLGEEFAITYKFRDILRSDTG